MLLKNIFLKKILSEKTIKGVLNEENKFNIALFFFLFLEH